MALLPITPVAEKGDYMILALDKQNHALKREADGILHMGYAKGGTKPQKSWEDFSFDYQMEYTNCSETPDIVPQILQRMMRFIDRVRNECTISITNDCARVMFKLVDADADQKITASEIKRAVALLMLFSELADKKILENSVIENIAIQAKEESNLLTDQIIKGHDKNEDGRLDYNEIVENFTAPQSDMIREALQKGARLLPAFKLAALHLK